MKLTMTFRSPNTIKRFTQYAGFPKGLIPAGEDLRIVNRPQIGNDFPDWKKGMYFRFDGAFFVIRATKKGFMAGDKNWPRWEQVVSVSQADLDETVEIDRLNKECRKLGDAIMDRNALL